MVLSNKEFRKSLEKEELKLEILVTASSVQIVLYKQWGGYQWVEIM